VRIDHLSWVSEKENRRREL